MRNYCDIKPGIKAMEPSTNPVSVIIVNFNGGPLLSDCVRSVFSSTVPVQVIVADNRSDDGSISDLRETFPGETRLEIIENPENLGFAAANNLALARARGSHILFLNPDCIIQPTTLEKMLAVMEERPDAGMAGCLIRNPDGGEQAGCRRSIPTPWRTFIRLSRLHRFAKYHPQFESYVQTGQPLPSEPAEAEAISGAFMLVRRDAIAAVGTMDEGYFMHCEDLDWCMRFHHQGLRILFVPHVEILHVGGVCSASRPIAVEYYKHKGMVRFYRKFFRAQYPTLLMWVVMTAIGLRFLARAAYHWVAGPRSKRAVVLSSGLAQFSPRIDTATEAVPRSRRQVLVTGATSLIGDYLLPGLVQSGFEVHAISRNPPGTSGSPWLHWHELDITKHSLEDTFGADALIHLAPLRILPPLIESLARNHVRRIIAFSSTSLFTKFNSHYDAERALAQGLQKSEDSLAELARRHEISWTVFRPTLVYNLGRDKNISAIARFIERFGFFPLVGEGSGLRQPVHAEDLAKACIAALDNPRTFQKAYNLSGGETLTYLEMVRRISGKVGREDRILRIPLGMLRVFLRGLSFIPGYEHLTPEMANRVNSDMCFDHQEAARDLHYSPRRFLEAGVARTPSYSHS